MPHLPPTPLPGTAWAHSQCLEAPCQLEFRVCPFSLEEEVVTHSSIPAWRIPWMEEPGRLQSMGSQSRKDPLFPQPPRGSLSLEEADSAVWGGGTWLRRWEGPGHTHLAVGAGGGAHTASSCSHALGEAPEWVVSLEERGGR